MKPLFAVAVLLSLGACRADRASLTHGARQALAASVDSATRAFESVQRVLDAEGAIAFLAPDFYMYVDGRRVGYDSVAVSIRRSFRVTRHHEPNFRDIEVIVLGPDAAAASFRFHDSIIVADGALQRFRGATTLVWARRAEKWQIVYADADHYAESVP
jgi:hypothetical protein